MGHNNDDETCAGFELATDRTGAGCSTAELTRQQNNNVRCHVESNHGPFGLQPKALPLSYNTKQRSNVSDTGNRTRGDWVRARHVTYYTISDGRVFPLRRPGIEPGSTEPQSVIMPLYNRRDANEQVLAGDRTLGLPRVKRAICQLSYENAEENNKNPQNPHQTLAGFEPAPPKGTDFESAALDHFATTSAQPNHTPSPMGGLNPRPHD